MFLPIPVASHRLIIIVVLHGQSEQGWVRRRWCNIQCQRHWSISRGKRRTQLGWRRRCSRCRSELQRQWHCRLLAKSNNRTGEDVARSWVSDDMVSFISMGTSSGSLGRTAAHSTCHSPDTCLVCWHGLGNDGVGSMKAYKLASLLRPLQGPPLSDEMRLDIGTSNAHVNSKSDGSRIDQCCISYTNLLRLCSARGQVRTGTRKMIFEIVIISAV